MIKAIIFDCFGVLVGRGFDETYRLAGGNPVKDVDFIEDLLGRANLGHVAPTDMRSELAEKLHISVDIWDAAAAKAEQPNEPLFAYITSLRSQYKLAIVSNANRGTLQRLLRADQLALFDAVVVSAEVGMVKPQPEIYQHTVEQLGVNLDECVFIDDIKQYLAGASALGMKTILYKDFASFKQKLEAILSSL